MKYWFDLKQYRKNMIFLTIMLLVMWAVIGVSYPNETGSYFTEVVAGMLGVMYAFTLDRQIESHREEEINDKIVENLLYELNENVTKLERLKMIHAPFDLFQTTSWDMWSDRIDLDEMEIMFELSSVYHRLQLFNEAKKLEGVTSAVSDVLSQYPMFYFNLKRDLKSAISGLEKVN